MGDKHAQTVELIPLERINVINPRVRNKKSFKAIVENIASVGLKKPVTVTRRDEKDGPRFDLVCGQGRVEAYQALGQKEIPALVVIADPEDCLIRSLVENCARRKPRAIELFHSIGAMKERGYSISDIAEKTGLGYHFVRDIARLLAKGEQRLLQAVETGQIPVTVAAEIAEADEDGAQDALRQAYEKKLLRGRKLKIVKNIIEQRRRLGKGITAKSAKRQTGLSSHALIRTYRQDTDRKRLLVQKANATSEKLVFVSEALRRLFADENFVTLLRAEGMETLPRPLAERISKQGGLAL